MIVCIRGSSVLSESRGGLRTRVGPRRGAGSEGTHGVLGLVDGGWHACT